VFGFASVVWFRSRHDAEQQAKSFLFHRAVKRTVDTDVGRHRTASEAFLRVEPNRPVFAGPKKIDAEQLPGESDHRDAAPGRASRAGANRDPVTSDGNVSQGFVALNEIRDLVLAASGLLGNFGNGDRGDEADRSLYRDCERSRIAIRRKAGHHLAGSVLFEIASPGDLDRSGLDRHWGLDWHWIEISRDGPAGYKMRMHPEPGRNLYDEQNPEDDISQGPR
jgi:hypothetical protein